MTDAQKLAAARYGLALIRSAIARHVPVSQIDAIAADALAALDAPSPQEALSHE